MTSYETGQMHEETPISEGSESYEGVLGAFSDGMEPIEVPAELTKENYQEVFGGVLPEGLSPDIFEEGGSLSLLN